MKKGPAKKMPKMPPALKPPEVPIRNFVSGCYFDGGIDAEMAASVTALAVACTENARTIAIVAQTLSRSSPMVEFS